MARRPRQRDFLQIPPELLSYIRELQLVGNQPDAVNFIHHAGEVWNALPVNEQPQCYEAYVIHGPPGTGKTFVIVIGTLLYLAKTDIEPPQQQVVILTHTNAAADRVVEMFISLFESAGIPPRIQHRLLVRFHKSGYNPFIRTVQPFCTDGRYQEGPPGEDLLHFHRNARIIVSTVFQPRRFQRFRLFIRGQLIIDEGSQLNPPLLTMGYSPLNPEVLGLVGDPNQLPPIYSLELLITDTMSYYLGRGSQFRRRLPNTKYVMLNFQHRMNPVISGLVNILAEFLNVPQQQLIDAPRTQGHVLSRFYTRSAFSIDPTIEHILDSKIPIILLDTMNLTRAEEMQIPGGSRFNVEEARLASDLFYLFNRKYIGLEENTAIIAPYSEQARIIGEGAATVDSYQGREADLVILSMVRKNFDSEIGFLSEINRLNVSLSRAKCKLVLIMDVQTFQGSEEYYRELINYCTGRNSGATTIQCNDNLVQNIREVIRDFRNER